MRPIYTLPEAFINDESVPVKWRLYGIINGFWVNGLTVYAANKYFCDKLGCAERTVSYALAELEKDNLVKREVIGHHRTIFPGGVISEDPAMGLQGGSNGVAGDPAMGLQPNASSNASNILAEETSESSSEGEDVKYVQTDEDGNEYKKRVNKTTKEMQAVFDIFSDNLERKVWKMREIERKSAQALYDEHGVEELRKRYNIIRKYRNDPMCPKIYKPSDMLAKMVNMETYLKTV